MKKNLFTVIFTIILLFIVTPEVKASFCSLSVSPSTITPGTNVTVRITGNDAYGRFDIKSLNPSILSGGGSTWVPNGVTTVAFTANKTGTVTISASSFSVANGAGTDIDLSCKKTINIVNKTNSSSNSSNKNSSSKNNSNKNTNNKEDSKSSDTALKSLMVEGKNLTPEFNKDVTSYNVTVDNDTKKIKINAEANDSKSTVTGAGEKDVKEGENKFDVVVTAENGDKKTYTINVTVDTKPIVVKVNGKKYTIVKKKEELPQLDIKHEDMSLNIEEQEIPAYRVDKLNYVLVGLKDSDGKVRLYIFESFKDSSKPFKYTLFRQLKFSQSFISYLEFPKSLIPDGYKKYKEKINDEEIEVYKLTKGSNYSLFYGINIETGEKSIYKYDSKENTIQRYDREELKALEKQMKENKLITIGFVGLSALLLIIIVLMIATRRIKKKKSVKYNKVLKQEKLKKQ